MRGFILLWIATLLTVAVSVRVRNGCESQKCPNGQIAHYTGAHCTPSGACLCVQKAR